MKKRLIGTLLLGALFVSSMSVFVSCKDYDDDINNLGDRVTVLEAAKVDLEKKIADLRADMEATYATKAALAQATQELSGSIDKEVARAKAEEAALSSRIQAAQEALDNLNTLIGGDISKSANFADCKTYKEALEKTWAQIEAVESGLGARLTTLEKDLNLDDATSKIRVYLNNLEIQIAALNAWQESLNADGGAATKNYVGTEIAAAEARAAIDAAEKAAKAEANAKSYTDAQLAEKIAQALQEAAKDATEKAAAAQAAAIAAAAKDATDKANAAEAAAKQFAAAEAAAKADAAEAAAKAYADQVAKAKADAALADAKAYADQVAKSKADAAEAAAKAYADKLLTEAKAYSDKLLAEAKTYADSKADAALSAAKIYADQVATAKANAAQTAAEAYADQKIALAKAECKQYAEQMRDAAINAAKTYTNDEIQKLKDNELTALGQRIDAVQAELNILQMISKQLRSLVFIPEGYIDGVEALEVFSLNFWRYNNYPGNHWISASYDKAEKNALHDAYNEAGFNKEATNMKRDEDHPSRYEKQTGRYRVLDFTAKYYMNPSTANVTKLTKNDVRPIVEDKWFDVTRGNIGMSVDKLVKPTDEGGIKGILQVQYKLANPNLIESGDKITVFATEVQYGDTTITSDYATFRNKYIDSLVLAHAPKELAPSFRNVRNTHCGQCDVVETGDIFDRHNSHLFATITEAAGKGDDIKTEADGFAPQDSVWYTSAGLELEKLVETHYRDVNTGKHKWMKDISAYGLSYGFELTYVRYGSNKTSESAHAVIDEKNGKHYLIPWAPSKSEGRDGVQSPYNRDTYETDKANYQTRQLIGRTPLVRVTLRDKEGNVLDYGYIRILITDTIAVDPINPPASPLRRFVEYTGPNWGYEIPWTVKNGCADYNNLPYEFENTWIEQQLDIYKFIGVSHNEFLNNYTPEYKSGNAGPLKQYAVFNKANNGSANNGKAQFTALPTTTEDELGEVTEKPNQNDPETNVLRWVVTKDQAKAAFIDKRPTSRSIAIRYKSNDGIEANDIYVIFNTGTITVTEAGKISGSINWDNRKNPNYWYEKNGWAERTGLVEVHANVYGVEDEKEDQTSELQQTIAAAFMENQLVDLSSNADKDAFITLTNGAGHSGKDLTLRLEFVKGALNTFKGIYTDGKIYQFVPKIADNGMTLKVFQDKNNNGVQDPGEAEQEIAKLVYTDNANQDINHMRVEYLKTDFAKALLNYWPHKVLNDNVLTAYVAVKAKIGTCEIELSGDPINIRFLRPINVNENPAEVRDASVEGKQVIYLRDIIKLDDWRDEPFDKLHKINYWYYYGVTDIQIVGVAAGGNLASNEDILTNMSLDPNAAPTKPLKDVSEMIELVYEPQTWTPTDPATGPEQPDFGTLTYTNLGSNVQQFTLKLPVKVKYIWGEVFTTVNVHVLCTQNNGARRASF